MGTKINLVAFLLVGALATGCSSDSPRGINEQDIVLMADLQCQARHLKDERFKMANELRLMEDSLMKHRIPLTDAQRQKSDSIRKALTLQTDVLAARVTRTMDSVFELHYPTIAQRQEFDEAVEKKMTEICR